MLIFICVWFCKSMDCSLPGSSIHGIFQAKILEWVASHFLLQGIFPTHRWNTCLLHLLPWSWILYHFLKYFYCLLCLFLCVISLACWFKIYFSIFKGLYLCLGSYHCNAFYNDISSIQFSSVQSLSPTLCDPMDCSTPSFPVYHQLPELAQIHVHRVSGAIQSSHPLSSPSSAFNLSQIQGLFQWVSSSHQVAKILDFQLQHQSLQWIFRTNFL